MELGLHSMLQERCGSRYCLTQMDFAHQTGRYGRLLTMIRDWNSTLGIILRRPSGVPGQHLELV